jgi:hypothetical protein
MSARRFTLWGAMAGAAFPVLLYTPEVIMRGTYESIPFFSMLAGLSALAGAVCGRIVFALATRTPKLQSAPGVLAASLPESVGDVSFATSARERDRQRVP